MLVIRMQRTGRKGHAQFRVVVQDSRRTPTSGKVVAALGSYNPHSKVALLDKEKAGFYLEHGAQPSDRVARLFSTEGVTLPAWVKPASQKTGVLRNADKLRRNQPKAEAPAAEPASDDHQDGAEEAPAVEPDAAETPAEESAETAADS